MRSPAVVFTALLCATVWLGSAVVRLENYHYANLLGFCPQYNIADPVQRIQREDCLANTETRTGWVWQLLYGLKIL